jgi:trigger factor
MNTCSGSTSQPQRALENLAKLEEIAKQQVEGNYKAASRNFFKKDVFDFLNKKYDFDLPEGLVEEQFKNLWAEVEEELKENLLKYWKNM